MGGKQIGTWGQTIVIGLVLSALTWSGKQLVSFYKANNEVDIRQQDRAAIDAAVAKAIETRFKTLEDNDVQHERRLEALEHDTRDCKVHP